MRKINHPPSCPPAPRSGAWRLRRSRGVALLMVLLIILAVTVLATGFLAGADMELACGANTLLRMQMDHLAQSGLEHARTSVLHPQGVPAEFWAQGATQQQLVAESRDYYDIQVAPDTNRPGDRCTYDITCEAYRLVGGAKTGRSHLAAKLRLDPCIGLWGNGDLQFRPTWMLYGDVRGGGTIVNLAPKESIAGDAFSSGLAGAVVGQHRGTAALSLTWPPVTAAYMNLEYAGGTVSGTLSNATYPPRIWRCTGNLVLAGNVTIQGMLLVAGDLTVRGNNNTIRAAENLPALYVSGHLTIENVNGLQLDGLVVVDQDVRISAAASNVVVEGALFVGGTLQETTADVSGNGRTGLLRGNPTWTVGARNGALQLDGVDDYVDGGTNPAFDLAAQITVAAWVHTLDAGDGKHHPYVTKGDRTYALKHRRLPADESDSIEFFIYDAAWQSARFPVDASFNGEWHHVAGTYDGANVKLYIDGVLKATTPHVGLIAVRPEQPLYVGANSEWADRFYQGLIDDVRIFNCALSEEMIGSIKAGVSVAAGLVAHWTLDEPGSGVTIIADPMKAAIVQGMPWDQTHWSPAAGGFFRSIRRP